MEWIKRKKPLTFEFKLCSLVPDNPFTIGLMDDIENKVKVKLIELIDTEIEKVVVEFYLSTGIPNIQIWLYAKIIEYRTGKELYKFQINVSLENEQQISIKKV